MIYSYEKAVLSWLNAKFPEVKQAIYASNEDLLLGGDTVKYYPAFYYSRDRYDVSIHRPIHVRSVKFEDAELYEQNHKSYVFYPYWIDYTGTMLIENQAAAFRIARTLKYYWAEHPKVTVVLPGMVYKDSEGHDVPVTVDVSLILQDISIEDVRLPNDKNGACRAVKCKWKSQLLLNDAPTAEDSYVDSVAIELQVLDNGTVVEKMNTVVTKKE